MLPHSRTQVQVLGSHMGAPVGDGVERGHLMKMEQCYHVSLCLSVSLPLYFSVSHPLPAGKMENILQEPWSLADTEL